MLPVQPTVGPTISLDLDVDDGEVENYEVGSCSRSHAPSPNPHFSSIVGKEASFR